MDELLPCSPKKNEDPCALEFVEAFGTRAYRRPVTQAEIDTLYGLYETGRKQWFLDFKRSIALVIEAVLQSPKFLFHWEESPTTPIDGGAQPGDEVPLDDYHLASRLSYFLWGSMPDALLFQAAENGDLQDDAGLEREVNRMLQTEAARTHVGEFFADLFDIDAVRDKAKDQGLYRDWDDKLKETMITEFRMFTSNGVFDGPGTLAHLLTSNRGYINRDLADVYGRDDRNKEIKAVDLDPTQRSGLLTLGAFLAKNGSIDGSNPTLRGAAIYYELLCGSELTPPNVVPEPPSAETGGTTRDRFAAHASMECAAACHANIDPLGFVLENYDGIGAYRTEDNGLPVDATSTIELDGKSHFVNDAIEFSDVLSKSDEVKACFAKQYYQYATGKNFNRRRDKDAIAILEDVMAQDNATIPDLIKAVAMSRAFRFRTVQESSKDAPTEGSNQ